MGDPQHNLEGTRPMNATQNHEDVTLLDRDLSAGALLAIACAGVAVFFAFFPGFFLLLDYLAAR